MDERRLRIAHEIVQFLAKDGTEDPPFVYDSYGETTCGCCYFMGDTEEQKVLANHHEHCVWRRAVELIMEGNTK
jgi:hypothetical protein